MPVQQFDAIVIGAGEAGALLASRAVEAGKRVALIYRAPYGGTCLNVGCLPSKYLIHRAAIAHLTRTAGRFHIATGPPRVDLAAIVRDKNRLIAEHREHSLREAQQAEGLTLIEGAARFVRPREIAVDGQRLTAERIVIAAGLRPDIPRLPGLDPDAALTSETLMELTEVPARLVVLGGGYVACELGQAFRRFGSEVTIIQTEAHLLAQEEPDVSTVLERALRAEGIDLLLGREPVRIAHGAGTVRVMVRDRNGDDGAVEGSHLLIATGRRPNTDLLGIEAAGIALDPGGHVRTDARLATNVRGIWAIGDINGQQPFTRVCQEEAKVAFANAIEGRRMTIDRTSLGHAVFTDPEIASVGVTEEEARRGSVEVEAGLVTFDQVTRARLTEETIGLIKYVVERRSRRILACHIIGPRAAELVYAVTVVVRRRGRLDELAKAVGIFPTLAEGLEGTARGLMRRIAPDAVRGPLVAGRSR
ncbi:MAG: dihydrolipoyl dehydrogenase family protein [Gemmatimonadales bacterium]